MLARKSRKIVLLAWLLAIFPSIVLGQNQGLRPVPQGAGNFGSGQPNSFAPPNNFQSNQVFANGPDARIASTGSLSSGNAPGTPPASPDGTTSDPSSAKIATRNLLQIFHDGGWMMYPIALCSFVLTVFGFERLIALRWGRVIPRPFVKRLIEQLQQQQIDRDEALELCERNPSYIAQVLSAAVKKYGKPSVEVEQAVLDAGERVSNHLRRHLRLLNSISNVSPLLGLLGTVLGMIEAFNAIGSSDMSRRSELLAGGIGHAMLTTAAGLLVAIPAYLSYMYFLSRTDRLIMEMDEYAQQVVEAISAEGLAENDQSRSRSRSRKAA